MKECNLKIFVAYHSDESVSDKYISKFEELNQKFPNVYQQIFGGYSFYKGQNQLIHNMLHDISEDSSKTISQYGKYLNELTNIYWIYKNYKSIGNPEYIGFCHYRRLIDLGSINHGMLSKDNILAFEVRNKILPEQFIKWKFITKTMDKNINFQNINDNIVYPDDLKKYLNDKMMDMDKITTSFKYIQIMHRDVFQQIMKFMETIIENCIKNIDFTYTYRNIRQFGYLCEFIHGIYLYKYTSENNLNIIHVKKSVIYI